MCRRYVAALMQFKYYQGYDTHDCLAKTVSAPDSH